MSVYPRHLLPKVYYRRMHTSQIPLSAHFVRFIDDMHVETKSDIKSNCVKILNPSHFSKGCSMNILSVFTKDDVKYKLEMTESPIYEEWSEGQRCYKPKSEEVSIVDNRCYCGVDYSGINDYAADIEYTDKTQKKRSGKLSYVFTHSPNLTNFWHYNMYMQISPSDESGTVVCKCNNQLISESQIKKIIVAHIDDLEGFLLEPSELEPCKIERWKYYSVLSVLKYIKRTLLNL